MTPKYAYKLAHDRARERLGNPPEICPTCAPNPRPTRSGRRTMQLSYVGDGLAGQRPYDITGEAYIWECNACNMFRSAKPLTEEHRAKISAAGKGRPHTLEHSAKISASLQGKPNKYKGVPRSEETKAKISAANKGKQRTPEQNARMSAARRGIPRSPEFRAKVSAGMKKLRQAQREARAINSLTHVGGIR